MPVFILTCVEWFLYPPLYPPHPSLLALARELFIAAKGACEDGRINFLGQKCINVFVHLKKRCRTWIVTKKKKENKKKKNKRTNSYSWLRTWKLLTYFNVFCPSTFVAFWVWCRLIHVVFWPTSKYPGKLVFNNQVVTNVFIDICVSAGQLNCSLLLG